MIGLLRDLAQRREALVALSEAQRTLLRLEVHSLRQQGRSLFTGSRLAPKVAIGAAAGLLALVFARRGRAFKLASAALAVYPLIRQLFAAVRVR